LMNNINRVVAFGCSYTSGEELLYHELGELDEYRKNTLNDPRLFFQKISKDKSAQNLLSAIRVKQLEVAWPAKLAKLLEVECVNFAEVGNSMDKILWQIEKKKLEKFFRPGDLILVGATNPYRNVFFKDHAPMSFQLPSLYWGVSSYLIGVDEIGNSDVVVSKDIDKHLVHWFNNDRIVWDYLKSLKVLQFLNINIVNAMSYTDIQVKKYNIELFNKMTKEIQYLQSNSMDTFANKEDYHVWGHPKEIVHERFAESIYTILKNG
jgi:hypothetical protein